MNIQILPILLSPLGSMPAQAPDVSAGLMFSSHFHCCKCHRASYHHADGGLLCGKAISELKSDLYLDRRWHSYRGACCLSLVGTLSRRAMDIFSSQDEWYSTVLILIIFFWPNLVGMLTTVLVVRIIIVRLLKNRFQDSTAD